MKKVVLDEPPPFLGSWKRVYIAVVCYLALVITLFYFFSKAYAP
jgi:hypothetical protein